MTTQQYQDQPQPDIHEGGQFISNDYVPSADTNVEHDDYVPTAGIDVGRQAIGDAGDFCVWDCAGHIEFHVTHNMFLGAENSIFIVAYDLSDDRKLHLKKVFLIDSGLTLLDSHH